MNYSYYLLSSFKRHAVKYKFGLEDTLPLSVRIGSLFHWFESRGERRESPVDRQTDSVDEADLVDRQLVVQLPLHHRGRLLAHLPLHVPLAPELLRHQPRHLSLGRPWFCCCSKVGRGHQSCLCCSRYTRVVPIEAFGTLKFW